MHIYMNIYEKYFIGFSGFPAELIRFHCPLGFNVCIAVLIMFVNRYSSISKTLVIS